MLTPTFQLLIETLKLALLLALPVLGATLACGVLSGTAQAATTVSDPSISTVPRLLAAGLAVLLAGPWIAGHLFDFALALWIDLGRFVR